MDQLAGKADRRWRSNLNSRKTVGLHNSYCVGELRYFCKILHLSVRERVGLDRRTRRAINQAGGHHPNASVDRLYLPGRQRVENVWEQTTVSAALYTLRSHDPQMRGVTRSFEILMSTLASVHVNSLYIKLRHEMGRWTPGMVGSVPLGNITVLPSTNHCGTTWVGSIAISRTTGPSTADSLGKALNQWP